MFVNHFYLFSTLVIYHRKSMVGVIATKIPLYGPKRRPTCRPLDELYAHVIPAQAGIQTDRSLGSCFRNTDRQSRCEHATFSSSVVPLAGFLPVIARSPGDEAISWGGGDTMGLPRPEADTSAYIGGHPFISLAW